MIHGWSVDKQHTSSQEGKNEPLSSLFPSDFYPYYIFPPSEIGRYFSRTLGKSRAANLFSCKYTLGLAFNVFAKFMQIAGLHGRL
jgi:hypothetical protein